MGDFNNVLSTQDRIGGNPISLQDFEAFSVYLTMVLRSLNGEVVSSLGLISKSMGNKCFPGLVLY